MLNFQRLESVYMDFILKAHNFLLLAGGSIPGDKRPLEDAEKWGVTLAGLGIVICALLLLVIVIFVFGRIFDALNTTNQEKAKQAAAAKAPKPNPAPVKKQAPAPKAPAPTPAPAADDDEVIAVISAVVAMMSEADGTTYKVKSVKPVQNGIGGRTAWAMDGRRNNVSPF
jgi:Na+-transporting methylmalonyl-CoA/oxaloacetate decarboxylase gamma subunit